MPKNSESKTTITSFATHSETLLLALRNPSILQTLQFAGHRHQIAKKAEVLKVDTKPLPPAINKP